MRSHWQSIASQAESEGWSHSQFLYALCEQEVERDRAALQARVEALELGLARRDGGAALLAAGDQVWGGYGNDRLGGGGRGADGHLELDHGVREATGMQRILHALCGLGQRTRGVAHASSSDISSPPASRLASPAPRAAGTAVAKRSDGRMS